MLVGLPGTVLESARIVAVSLEVPPGCTAVGQADKLEAPLVADTPAGKFDKAAGVVGSLESLPAPGQGAVNARQSNR